LRDALRAEVERGRWSGTLPSERDLSREFHVSRPTIHVALRSLEREGLVEFRRGLPWRIVAPTGKPRSVPQRQPQGMLLRSFRLRPDATALMPLVDPLREKLHRLGLGLLIKDPLVNGLPHVEQTLADLDVEHRPSFYFLASLPTVVHRWFEPRKIPALIFGSRAPDIHLPAIETTDPEATIQHAVEHLARRGHQRITLLDLPTPESTGAANLYASFARASAGWSQGKLHGMVVTSLARPTALETAVDRIVGRARRSTAVIVTDLELTIGLYTILAQLGLRIPRDVSVLCFYHWPILDVLRPLPTCYQFSWETVANRIVRVIADHQRLGVWPDKFTKLLPTLREGKSVARFSNQ
jgi:DNA-binding LacI/PurR family transcriptional regulator